MTTEWIANLGVNWYAILNLIIRKDGVKLLTKVTPRMI
jgi:hypothetical protein